MPYVGNSSKRITQQCMHESQSRIYGSRAVLDVVGIGFIAEQSVSAPVTETFCPCRRFSCHNSQFSMFTNDRSDSMCSSSRTKKEKRPVIPRGCATDQFPGKLFDLLAYCENQGMTEIISWVGNGTAFMVHDTDRLLDLLPMFRLGQTKYRSFQRQL